MGQALRWSSFHKYDLFHPHQQPHEKILWFPFCRCGNWTSNMFNCSPQAVRRPKMWVIIYTGDREPLESRLWAYPTPLFGSRKFPPHCCVRWQQPVPLAFIFSSTGSGSFSLRSLSVCEMLTVEQPWPYPALLSHVCGSVPRSPTWRLPASLDSRDSLWLQCAHWHYQCDHRSYPIACLHLEFSKVDMRVDVFWIPREVQLSFFFFPYGPISNYLYSTWANLWRFFVVKGKNLVTLCLH